jgi:hypothetical protein
MFKCEHVIDMILIGVEEKYTWSFVLIETKLIRLVTCKVSMNEQLLSSDDVRVKWTK